MRIRGPSMEPGAKVKEEGREGEKRDSFTEERAVYPRPQTFQRIPP